MIIYADVLFLINFLSSYILTGVMRYFKKREINIKRRLLSSACTGVSALVIFIADFEHYTATIVYISTAMLNVFICFGRKSFFLNTTIFAMLNILLCGIGIAFISLSNSPVNMYIKNNILYFDIDEKIFLATIAVSYPMLCVFSVIIKRRTEKKLHSMTIVNKNKLINITALYDSGNLLKDPISQKSVIVLDKSYAKQLITPDQEFIKIPYSTIGGPDYMDAFVVDLVIIDDTQILSHQYIALAEESLCLTDEYCALLGDIGGY